MNHPIMLPVWIRQCGTKAENEIVRFLKCIMMTTLVAANLAPSLAQTTSPGATSSAQTASPIRAANVEGLLVSLGDTPDKVKAAYDSKLEPEPYDSPGSSGTTFLRLKTKGVWCFFGKDGKVYTIRLEAPFAGKINGVKIGDSLAQMLKVLGNPDKLRKPFAKTDFGKSYIYYLDDVTTADFEMDTDGQVETVFLAK
jgi:hypothetical protein